MSANWRGHIGLVEPTLRGKTFAFWYRNLPLGVELCPTTLDVPTGEKDSFQAERGFKRAEDLATSLRRVGCQVITIAGSPLYILAGAEHEAAWRKELEARLGVTVVTGMSPHVVAARALGIKRIGVATYFRDELNQGISERFLDSGIQPEIIPGFEQTRDGEGLYTTPMRGLDSVSHEDVYRHCRAGVERLDGKVDGLYINGGGWDASPALGPLEQDLGIPVIWAQTALMWLTLGLLGVGESITGYGRLLSDSTLRQHDEISRWKVGG